MLLRPSAAAPAPTTVADPHDEVLLVLQGSVATGRVSDADTRLDYRLTEDDEAYLLEANPNPQIAKDEDFALSAKHIGMDYPELIEQLIKFGINYEPDRITG